MASSDVDTNVLRRGHAVLDLPSRERKARKIARLIGAEPGSPARRLLEVGTGSGGIAHWFGQAGPMQWDVESVDVEDVRRLEDGYRFTRVEGVELPFADGAFDVVVSNHVIEHVGDIAAQSRHLRELGRVLRPDGVGYLAVPNRWMLVEPHYKLAFLSWLPRRLRSPYLAWRRGIEHYDCEPLSTPALEQLLARAGWTYEAVGIEAVRVMRELEPGSRGLALFDGLPGWAKRGLQPWLPTLIYRLRLVR